MTDPFADRHEAGRLLAEKLMAYAGRSDVTILGLPRGGVPVAFEVALALEAPLEVFIVRKIGVPGHPELAMGAIASGGARHLNDRLIQQMGIPNERIEEVVRTELAELGRRERVYRGNREPLDLEGRVAILVDDGLATGASMQSAIQAITTLEPKEIIVAVPVIAASSVSEIESKAKLVYVLAPHDFYAVGEWYRDFGQTSDDEVLDLLEVTKARKAAS